MDNFVSHNLVSVIVPSYNHEHFITSALDSIAAQTHNNIEVIIVDDKSKDESYTMIEKWKQFHQKTNRFVNIITERNTKNIGAHATINKGLDLASGEWLTILNSDDCYMKQRLEKLLICSHKSGAELVLSGVRVIDEEGKRHQSKLAAKIESLIEFANVFPDISFALLEHNMAATTGNLFFSRKLFKKIGYFDNLKYTHDWDFLLRSTQHFAISTTDEVLYQYRIHENNSFQSLKFEEKFEPLVILRKNFFAANVRNFSHEKYASLKNWQNIYQQYKGSFVLSYAEKLVGKSTINFNDLLTYFED